MTLDEIRELLITVDPDIRHHRSEHLEPDYTYWDETHLLGIAADNSQFDDWAFVVHRYTKRESDHIAKALFNALNSDPRVAMVYRVDHSRDEGYIHHIFDCEGY